MTPQLRKELVRSQGVASGGNTLRLSFEYQAFIVAARTTLDYLAGTLNAYFGCEDASFHDWPDALDVAKPRDVARQMAKVLQPLHERLEHFYSSALRRSVRDRIAHYEFVPAAHISIGPLGVVLHEGGERLDGSAATQKLTNALTKHFDAVNQVVKETINTLIDLDEFQR
ncbi:MAG: hypothetical protein ACKVPX_09990 [Myxococcaceae bacterium]